MKTLQSGAFAMLLLCGFISCTKEMSSDELSRTSTSTLVPAESLSVNNPGSACPDCVTNLTASSETDAVNAVLKLEGSSLLSSGTTIKTVATTKQTFIEGNVIVTVSHDAENVYFTFERNNATGKFGGIRFYSPAVVPVPTTGNGNKAGFQTEVKKIQVVRSRASLAACSSISFSFNVHGGGNATFGGSVTSGALTYVLRDVCPPKCAIAIGDYRTHSRGFWRNNNGQAFLTANTVLFDLTIGDGANTQTFKDAASVKTFLESGIANGTPGILPSPGTYGAQVLSLLINVKADNLLADYSKAESKLAKLAVNIDDADIAAHPSWAALVGWNGKSVQQILEVAQKVLAGTSTEYSPSHMNEVVTAINENFENGTVDTGFLTCGK